MTKKEILEIIAEIREDVFLEINAWESNFIESILEQLEKKDILSNKQAEVLQNIRDKESRMDDWMGEHPDDWGDSS